MVLHNYYNPDELEVGIDEAGCGSLISDLVVSAVILPKQGISDNVRDSKKVSKKNREILCKHIKENAIDYSIISIPCERVDEINIYRARLEGYKKVLDALDVIPDRILIDGNVFDYYTDYNETIIPHHCIKGGDNRYKSIAAASILAKYTRDTNVLKLHEEYPVYSWNTNFGYGTSKHIEMIKKYGITKYHRKTYGICKLFK